MFTVVSPSGPFDTFQGLLMTVSAPNASVTLASSFKAPDKTRASLTSRTPRFAHVAKVAGVLALSLIGGRQTAYAMPRHAGSLNSTNTTSTPPYDYKSICDQGTSDLYADQLNNEDCTVQIEKAIGVDDALKRQDKLKKCYTFSGYTAAAALVPSAVGCLVKSEFLIMFGTLITTFGATVSAVCGVSHFSSGKSLSNAEEYIDDCCDNFEKKDDVPPKSETPNTP